MDDYKKAKEWSDNANSEKQEEFIEPIWSWDCGFRLDFDGGLIRVSSRFYQSESEDDIFYGSVKFLIGDDELFKREFSSCHIDLLKYDVEKYVAATREKIKKLCDDNLAILSGE